mgnify:CR=1 FL=1
MIKVPETKKGKRLTLAGIAVAAVVIFFLYKKFFPELDLQTLLDEFANFLGPWTYLVIGILSFLETGAFVGLLVPGETALLIGGAVAGQGVINVYLLIAIAWVMAFLGDTTSFWLGHRLGREFILKHGPRFGISHERYEQVEDYFAKHGGKTVLIGRFIGSAVLRFVSPGLTLSAVAAGAITLILISANSTGALAGAGGELGHRHPRRAGIPADRGLHLLHFGGPGGGRRHAGGDPQHLRSLRAPVHPRRGRRAGALPLPGRRLRHGPDRRAALMFNALRRLGALAIDGIWQLGFVARFFWLILVYSGQSFLRLHLTVRELYFSGVLSLLIILVSGLFVGLVLGLQGYETLQRYGSADALGTLVALSLVRELGPVVAALLFASRAGSAVTAEIGLMKVTEQLKAMDMMAVSPIARVVAPRFWGGVLSMPLLAALFSAMGIFGGWLIGVVFIGVDDGAFWSQMQGSVDFRYDVLNGVIKSAVFGVAVALISVFEGYDCVPTAEGVSRAITRTVVSSALAILALDFVMTSFMFRG